MEVSQITACTMNFLFYENQKYIGLKTFSAVY